MYQSKYSNKNSQNNQFNKITIMKKVRFEIIVIMASHRRLEIKKEKN